MTMPISGRELGTKLIESGCLPGVKNVKRIVIDIPAEGLVKVFYETFASEELGDILAEELLAFPKEVKTA